MSLDAQQLQNGWRTAVGLRRMRLLVMKRTSIGINMMQVPLHTRTTYVGGWMEAWVLVPLLLLLTARRLI
jgi:hypothetical protein